MSTKTDIANFALAHIGHGIELSSLDSDNNKEAKICRRFFDVVIKRLLRSNLFSFSTKTVTLVKVADDPTQEWAYSYRYPSECLYAFRILPTSKDVHQEESFRTIQDSSGRLIYSNKSDAELEIIENISNFTYFPEDFALTASYLLAHYITPFINKGDPFGQKAQMYEYYDRELNNCQSNAYNEEKLYTPPSDFERARNG